MRLAPAIEAVLLLILACVVALFGAGIPVHFRAVAPGVLVEAGRGTDSVQEVVTRFMDAGKVGPAKRLLKSLGIGPRHRASRALAERESELLATHPHFALSGGPAPYFEQFLKMIRVTGPPTGNASTIDFLISSENRAHLRDYLKFSSNAAVGAVTATRAITGMTRFMPVASPAGHPLEATLLTTALLIQGGHLTPELTSQVKMIAESALDQDFRATDQLEEVYLAILALAKRFNWAELTELVALIPDTHTLSELAALIRRHPDQTDLLYGSILMSSDPPGLLDYLGNQSEEAWANLAFAIKANRGAVAKLLSMGQPLYRPPAFLRMLDQPISWVRQAPLLSFTHRHPQAAVNLKILTFLIAGYVLALVLSDLREATVRSNRLARLHPVRMVQNSFVAMFLATTLWVLMGPALFASGPEQKARLRLVFDIDSNLESLRSQKIESTMLDQVTILITGLFFLLQLIVYAFCLIKIAELKKQDANPDLKLRLIENEENLFDLGLYVGLGGTVGSLILLAMDIVQASLIAAYSSTLFGIIFVAILKVIHVRPFRRSLIMRMENRDP